ncbi:MAG: hypothetical protein GY779_18465 [Gammaproteobacteria bacterium]|nr:hypothetical protein [Gammaproteobacteria bacterium]
MLEYLEKQRGMIRSTKGGWFPGKAVFCHGYSMMDDFVGKKSFFQVLILNATGKLVEKPLADWVEAIHICLSWPDPRIWCNQIGALCGTARTTVVAATVAGSLAADSKAYGGRTLLGGLAFIQNALTEHKAGRSTEEIVANECGKHGGKPVIVGYARPLAKGDERLVAMERVTSDLNFTEGEHLTLAYEIEQILLSQYDEGMNINGYMSAFLSDQGFTPMEIYRIFALMVMSGVTACYVDAEQRPAETFLPLRCADIDFRGKSSRPVPDPE